jgi:EmrB/QacA subfamily drug resistance transporter
MTDRRHFGLTVLVAGTFFMEMLDGTILATAGPRIARSFGVDSNAISVAITAYLLTVAVLIPLSGWLSERFGARRVFILAIALFTIASAACAFSRSLTELTLLRVAQGAGGAMMVPVGRLLLLRTAAKSELVAAMAWLTVPALLGPVVGPPVGGFIVTYFDWRWTFYINIPVGIIGLVAVTIFIKDFREPPRGGFDLRGLILSGAALACFMFGLESWGRGVVAPSVTGAMMLAGLAGGFLYYLHARRHRAPLLDFTLMRLPCFGLSFCAMMLFRTGIGAIPFLLPMMLQVGFGDSAARSGLITFASSAGALVMKPAAQHALRQFGFRYTLIWNGILSGIMLTACAAFRPTWPAAAIYLVLLVGGFLRSLQFTAYNTLAYGDVPRAQMSAATSLYTAGQQLAATIGVTVGAMSLEISRLASGHATPMISDFSAAFVVVGLMTLVAAPIAVLMPASAGDELTGRHAAVPETAAPAARPGE